MAFDSASRATTLGSGGRLGISQPASNIATVSKRNRWQLEKVGIGIGIYIGTMKVFLSFWAKETKKDPAGSFFVGAVKPLMLIAFTTENPQQCQQALENVENVHVKREGCADVIGFTTINNLLKVIQHVGAENCNCRYGNCHHAST